MERINLKSVITLVCLMSTVSSNVFAVVSGAWVEGNKHPDKYYVSGRNIDEILDEILDGSMTDAEKANKIWKYVMTNIYHSPSVYEPLNRSLDSGNIDALKHLHSYGSAICGQNAPVMNSFFEKAGFRTRTVNLPAHTVPEVYYDGNWHMIDGDGCGYAVDGTGKIASVDEIRALSLTDRAALFGNSVSADDPHYQLPGYGYDHLWDYNITYAYPYFGYSYSHSMDITLRPGETFTRYFDRQWSPSYQFWGNNNSTINTRTWGNSYVKIPNAPPTQTSGYNGFGMYANGEFIYTPNLSHSSCFEGMLASTDVVSQSGSPKLAGTSGSSEVIFYMRTPYVIAPHPSDDTNPSLAGATKGAVISGSAVGSVTMSISYTMGASWISIGSLSGSFSNDISDYVKGRYQYWVKFNFTNGSGLDDLTLNTRVMVNSMMLYSLCGLENGVNNVTYTSDNLSVREIVPDIWTSQAIYEAGRYSDSNAKWNNVDTAHLTLTSTALPLEVVYKVDCPGAIRKLDLTCHYQLWLSQPFHEMYYSTDNGSSWVLISSHTPDSWVYSSRSLYNGSAVLSGSATQCLVKFKITPDPAQKNNNGFRGFFIYAYYENPSTSELEITHGWQISGSTYTQTQTIPAGTNSYSYTVNVGGALPLGSNSVSPGNKYIKMYVPIPTSGTTISGYVKNNSSAGVSGVLLSLSGSSTGTYTTTSSGFYVFSVSTGANYTVTPTKTDWNINPVNKSYTNIMTAQGSQDFFGSYTGTGYDISGTVTTSTSSALGGVTITLSGDSNGSTTTNGSGAYQFSTLPPGNYTVAPSLSNWSFSPVNRTYSGLGTNQTSQNFTGTYVIPSGYSEFVCSIKSSGGDYKSIAGWETAIQSDITSAASKVFSGAKTGTINDGASVTGATSGATATVYHCTASQLYVNVIAGTFQTGEQIRVDSNNYFTAGNTGDKVIAVAECYPMTDTTPVSIFGWTTNATNYIEIRTPDGYKHSGKWDTNAYILSAGTTTDSLYIGESNVRINGLQINFTKNDIDGGNGIDVYGDETSAEDIRISNCIIKGPGNFTTSNKRGIFGSKTAATGQNSIVRIWNNLIYDMNGTGTSYFGMYIRDADRKRYLYNNTAVNCGYGYYSDEASAIAKNNIAQDCTDGFGASFDGASDYNISDVASDAPGANSKNGVTVTFENKTGKDFHIAVGDTQAQDAGVDLSADVYLSFNTDIDGTSRSGTWDIGADEYSAGGGDVTPPNAPTNLTSSNQTQATITMDWTASTQAGDGDSASFYRIYRDAVLISTAVGIIYTDSGLTAGITYSYGVYAVDDSNNVSVSSASGSFSTSAGGSDTTPPNAPSSLSSSAQTETSITMSWTASAQAGDGDYASYYRVYRNALGLVGSADGTTFTDTGLTKNTTYSYYVFAVDDSSNVSISYALGSFSTSGSDITPPAIVSVSVTTATIITIEFSEPIEQTSAEEETNYEINNSVNVINAVLGSDQKTVTLTTSQHSVGTTYTITINYIKDLSGTPNTISANSTMNYMYGDTTAPEAVSGLGAKDYPTDKGGKVIVTWTNVSDSDIAGYKVYYSPNPFTSITGATYFSGSPVSNPNTSSCVVTGLVVNSQDYYFGVLAIDLSGNVSGSISSVGPVRAINNRLGETINGQKVYEVIMNSYNLKAKVIANPGLNDGVYINIKKPEDKTSKITQANTAAQNDTRILSTTINDLSDTSTEFNALMNLVEKVTIVLAYPSTITGETENGLRIYCLNETSNEWELVPGAQELSPLANTVAVEVEHFSVYRIMGAVLSKDNLKEVRVYPNPFKPNDNKLENGDWNTGIVFDNLTNNSTIKIYTLTGELVNTLEETNNDGKYIWDVKNKEKEKVSSGTYIYIVTNTAGDKMTGKMAIVR
ncbi:MAG: hypothetical protein A2252_00365 [Elusimicrobia bacterium RIFOXYA2_FULL_39_19]|nr:MAG: hypothetical protein A2252_00365 [Elusimicrobia bacterium RIFOXYA2_FULL_39_19]